MFEPQEIVKDIYWVGALEWNERYIHGMSMPDGSTNNSYLILDEKITLIDTCQHPHFSELLERVSRVTDPSKIDYIVSNHSEKDHAGSIIEMLKIAPNAKVVTSFPNGEKILKTYLPETAEIMPVKTGDTLNIGKRELQFVHTPMVHWPDNMVTYSAYDKILFSNDAFGQFFATSKRFDDEVGIPRALEFATSYFANIITPFVPQTKKALEAVNELDIDLICPAHGVIWRSGIEDIKGLYERMCSLEPENKAVIAYSSMYGTTERMAFAMAEAFMSKGVKVRVYNIDISDISNIITDVYFAKYVAMGSSTHNKTILPYAGEMLTYLKGLSPKGRIGIAFGSYGWAPTGQAEIQQVMEGAGYQMPLEPLTQQWNDSPESRQEVFDTICKLVDDNE